MFVAIKANFVLMMYLHRTVL